MEEKCSRILFLTLLGSRSSLHGGLVESVIGARVTGHSHVCSLFQSRRSPVYLLRTICFARARSAAQTHSLTHSFCRCQAHGKEDYILQMHASFSDNFDPQCALPSRLLTLFLHQRICRRSNCVIAVCLSVCLFACLSFCVYPFVFFVHKHFIAILFDDVSRYIVH